MSEHIKLDFLIPIAAVLNSNQRLHPHAKAKKTRHLRNLAATESKGIIGPEPCRIIAYLGFPDKRRRDPNNWAGSTKALLDGLVDSGVFSDDNHHIIQGPDHRILDYKPPKGHIYILLETHPTEPAN